MYNAPCKDCPDRQLGCHAECEKYKDFDNQRKQIGSQRILSVKLRDYRADRNLKITKRNNKRK